MPRPGFTKWYAVAYDCLLEKPFLRNHIFLGFMNILGLWYTEYNTLQLLDIINISPVIADIIKSVTTPGLSLGLVFYLFLITSVIWAAFGMVYFPSDLEIPLW